MENKIDPSKFFTNKDLESLKSLINNTEVLLNIPAVKDYIEKTKRAKESSEKMMTKVNNLLSEKGLTIEDPDAQKLSIVMLVYDNGSSEKKEVSLNQIYNASKKIEETMNFIEALNYLKSPDKHKEDNSYSVLSKIRAILPE